LPPLLLVLPWPGVRILLDYRPALRERTGVGEYAHQLATALARLLPAADQLTLFSSSWKDRLTADRVPGATVVDARVPVLVLNAAWHRLGWPPVERFAGAIDVAHSMHPLLMPARRAARIVTVHDLDFLDHPERASAEIRRDYASLAPTHARSADAVIAVSRFTAGEVERRLGVARDRLFIASSGAPSWTPRREQPARGPILFMGTLEPRKNVGTLLAAYRLLLDRVPDAPPLWLAGGAGDAAAPWLRALEQPPLAGRAVHLGYVAHHRRLDLYTQASMLVLPSHLEGFGIPVLEAMTLGVPVIVSTGGALPEVAGDAAPAIPPDDVRGFAEAMARYLTDPAAVGSAVDKGLARSRAYTWDASARTLLQVYAEVVARRSARERAVASEPRERSASAERREREREGGAGGAKPPGRE
jgi:glycosyltransferase involved in cell wall biosynthesis